MVNDISMPSLQPYNLMVPTLCSLTFYLDVPHSNFYACISGCSVWTSSSSFYLQLSSLNTMRCYFLGVQQPGQSRPLRSSVNHLFKSGPKKNHDSQRRDRILPFFLHLEIWQFSPHLGRFPSKLHSKRGEKGNNPLEKIQKMETAPRNCRFLSLVVAEHVLWLASTSRKSHQNQVEQRTNLCRRGWVGGFFKLPGAAVQRGFVNFCCGFIWVFFKELGRMASFFDEMLPFPMGSLFHEAKHETSQNLLTCGP